MTPSEEPLWWMSFTDPDKAPPLAQQRPGGKSFLGVTIVQAHGPQTALSIAWALGINPGGQVATWGPFDRKSIPMKWWHRLLTADEAMTAGAEMAP